MSTMTSDEPIGTSATERTPLLGDSHPADHGLSAEPGPDTEEQPPLTKEASTKELILVLGSIWLGVFLAALGMTHTLDYRLV